MILMDLNIFARLARFYNESKHVLSVSYKPTMDVFKRTLKIVVLGILLMGVMGFIIWFIVNCAVSSCPAIL